MTNQASMIKRTSLRKSRQTLVHRKHNLIPKVKAKTKPRKNKAKSKWRIKSLRRIDKLLKISKSKKSRKKKIWLKEKIIRGI